MKPINTIYFLASYASNNCQVIRFGSPRYQKKMHMIFKKVAYKIYLSQNARYFHSSVFFLCPRI